MYAVIGRASFIPERFDEVRELVSTSTIPMVKQQPGFISATWMRSMDGMSGTVVVLVESEEAANTFASLIAEGPPPGAPATFLSADVFEVIAHASA